MGAIGVALGAFGAHGLEDRLTSQGRLDTWETATFYLFVHTLALLILSGHKLAEIGRFTHVTAWSWIVGVVLFSGSLYLLSLTNVSVLGAITPIGGVSFLVGWLLLLVTGLRGKDSSVETQ